MADMEVLVNNGHMRENYIGIDPGKKGFACIYNGYGYEHYPLFTTQKSNQINVELVERLRELVKQDTICVIESVHAMPGQGVSSSFTFGMGFGMVIGVVQAIGIPYELVTPTKWQREMVSAADKSESTKKTSLNAAVRLHPNMDFRKSRLARNFDDNKVDATLICDYARRKNL